MNIERISSERLVGLFLLGVVLLTPPFMLIVDAPTLISGFPVLYLYLFVAWFILIILLALIAETATADHDNGRAEADDSDQPEGGEPQGGR